jgi:hypothetical protein
MVEHTHLDHRAGTYRTTIVYEIVGVDDDVAGVALVSVRQLCVAVWTGPGVGECVECELGGAGVTLERRRQLDRLQSGAKFKYTILFVFWLPSADPCVLVRFSTPKTPYGVFP